MMDVLRHKHAAAKQFVDVFAGRRDHKVHHVLGIDFKVVSNVADDPIQVVRFNVFNKPIHISLLLDGGLHVHLIVG